MDFVTFLIALFLKSNTFFSDIVINIGANQNRTDGKHSINCHHNNIWRCHNIFINTATQMRLVDPIMGLDQHTAMCAIGWVGTTTITTRR